MIKINSELEYKIKQFAEKQNVTPEALLFQVMSKFLHRAEKQQDLSIGTILSNRTKEGMVDFHLNEESSQWDISKAKEIHRMLGEAIEAAVSDTLIYKFLTTKVGLSEDKAARALLDFRELRQGTRGIAFPF